MSTSKGKKTQQRSAIADVVAREYTIHMHKRVCLPPPVRCRLEIDPTRKKTVHDAQNDTIGKEEIVAD